MKMEHKKHYSVWDKISHAIKNDLFLFASRNFLARLGLDIMLYYWVQEEHEPCNQPKIKGDASKYTVRELSIDEVIAINQGNTSVSLEDVTKSMKQGQICLGLETEGEIAAYNLIGLEGFNFKGREFKLKPNEFYLSYMWTFHEYRGRNLAPYLRYESYRYLEKKGRDRKYSITDRFNKSSIRFKKKLNSKHLNSYLSIGIFNLFTWNYTLRQS
ncbi:hypothetical protein GCM10007028_21580 [Algibacter mikhailovii]|uniref:N-acetyltransferase domain-containing protein n=2 Tax=Algibacter mikhailovii TaxID=425498 RepID=A0A918R5V1_9FLAO|nr:hypothetical protein GCM10007028_21580 [Algibacter mikhailovii]